MSLTDNAVLFGRRAIKVLLRNARFQDTDRGTKYYEKQGGYVEAKADFKSLNPKNVHTYAKVRRNRLSK